MSCARFSRAALVVVSLAVFALSAPAAWARDELRAIPVDLPARFQAWLEEVDTLITDEEWSIFLALREDYQRDAFIDAFWRQRDPYPDTARNELRERFDQRTIFARQRFEDLRVDKRARFLMTNGIPDRWVALDCRGITHPMEVWIYDLSLRHRDPFPVFFFRRYGLGPWIRWDEIYGTGVLFDGLVDYNLEVACPGLGLAFEGLQMVRKMNEEGGATNRYMFVIDRLEQPDEPPAGEWVSTFASYSTEVPETAIAFDAEVTLSFPGWRQSRTVVQGLIEIEADALPPNEAYGYAVYNLSLNGEILHNDKLLDQFRYRFDMPATDVANGRLPLVFQRYLRPGDYRLILMLQDLDGHHAMRKEIHITVPAVNRNALPVDLDPAVAKVLGDANRLIAAGESAVEIVMPHDDLTTGLVRFDARVFGDQVDHVIFALDGKPIMTRKRPPFSVELDFGSLPRTQVLRVTAHDAAGAQLASDERMINGIPYRFEVRFVDPVAGTSHSGSVRTRVDVRVPEGATLDRLEIYRGDERLATLYEPPFVQPISLISATELAILRTVGYLDDGTSAEDVVLINGPAIIEEIGVDFVELYTTVVDKRRRPVRGLLEQDFRIFEDDRQQTIARFATLDDVPVNVLVLLDTSASMAPRMERARQAALRFFERAQASARSPAEPDRIGAIAFNDRPTVVSGYTGDAARFAAGIAATKAERGTALYDSLIYAQFYAGGLRGHRAILLLSDGVDESSRFTFEQALEYARRSEVSIYTIGLDLDGLDKDNRKPARRALERFAEDTGGSAFFISDVTELESVYDQVLDELRAKYLLAYQSDNSAGDGPFRRVEVKLGHGGLEAKTLRGYYP
jgi:VWFA-related protein